MGERVKIDEFSEFLDSYNEEDTWLILRYCELRASCERNFASKHLMLPVKVEVRKQAGRLTRLLFSEMAYSLA